MATFIINEDTGSPQTVEADRHYLQNGYFYFVTEHGEDTGQVLTLSQTLVMSITRK